MRAGLRIAGRAARPARPVIPATVAAPAQDAWRVLDTVRSWVTFADAKAGAVLAVAGVIGGVLINLGRGHVGSPGRSAALIAAVFLAGSVICAGIALRPRRSRSAAPINLIYFGHIASSAHPSRDAYLKEFGDLMQDPARLVDHIADQVWAVSHVAKAKYDWVNRALILLLCAVAMLGVSVVTVYAG